MLDHDFEITTINEKINYIIKQSNLCNSENNFFIAAKKANPIPVETAIQIAFNWSAITKNFLYTSIRGLAAFVDKIFETNNEPDECLLYALQTSFYVISDDLNSVHPIFKEVAPKGLQAIHFKWWDETILKKLIPLSTYVPTLEEDVKILLSTMKEFSTLPFGTAIQLRIVEAIALDICMAFNSIFSKVIFNDKYIFKKENDRAWILSHIKAEVLHNSQVCDKTTGMASIINTPEEKEMALNLIEKYSHYWSNALTSLASRLS